MPAKTTAPPPNKETDTNAFIQDYLADWDDNDDPFRSPSPEPSAGAKKNDKKRKEPDTLGIDEQIDLTKKARVPRVKLDETRLLSEKGIPALRKRAPKLKLKGKGHEFSDAARLLSFYQEWLDDLFPKATFLDALAMVEKTGHKTIIRNERLKWIEEGKPKAAVTADDDDPFGEDPVPRQASRIAPIFENSNSAARKGTPPNPDDDLFGDEDIYNATPRRDKPPQTGPGADVPDDDDLDALMAEAEASGATQEKGTTKTTMPAFGSIFGGGGATNARPAPPQPSGELDDDDLDALMAEAEGISTSAPPGGGHISIFGGGKQKEAIPIEDDDDDLDALMAEAEAQVVPPVKATVSVKETLAGSNNTAANEKGKDAEKPTSQDDEEDELNALMAEAAGPATTASNPNNEQQKGKGFEDEEEAMAEMDGLW